MTHFGRWKAKIQEDPVFGTLRFQSVGFWEGKLDFGGDIVEFVVEAGAEGPEDHQRRTAELLSRDYERLTGQAKSAVETVEASVLTVESISFEQEPSVYEIVFTCRDDSYYYNVRVNGDKAEFLGVDG